MSAHSPLQRATLWALGWIERYRYIKFGIVGASGTVVNLVVLHLGHEYVFNAIEASYKKPYFSLALAIATRANPIKALPLPATSPASFVSPNVG